MIRNFTSRLSLQQLTLPLSTGRKILFIYTTACHHDCIAPYIRAHTCKELPGQYSPARVQRELATIYTELLAKLTMLLSACPTLCTYCPTLCTSLLSGHLKTSVPCFSGVYVSLLLLMSSVKSIFKYGTWVTGFAQSELWKHRLGLVHLSFASPDEAHLSLHIQTFLVHTQYNYCPSCLSL